MIVTCSACQKRYLIERESLGLTGRPVKCVACGHTWQQDPPKDSVRYADLPTNQLADRRERHKTNFGGVFFLGAVLVFATFVGFVTFGKEKVVRLMPAMQTIYTRLGFDVHPVGQGLRFENLTPLQMEGAGGFYQIVLKGDIVNGADQTEIVPPLKIVVHGSCRYAKTWPRLMSDLGRFKNKILGRLDQEGDQLCVLDTWAYDVGVTRLMAGERAPFKTPPHRAVVGAEDVTVEF